MLISSACQKDKLPLCFQAFFASVQTSSSKSLFQDARGGTFRIVIAYEESIIAIFEDIGQSKLSQDVDRR